MAEPEPACAQQWHQYVRRDIARVTPGVGGDPLDPGTHRVLEAPDLRLSPSLAVALAPPGRTLCRRARRAAACAVGTLRMSETIPTPPRRQHSPVMAPRCQHRHFSASGAASMTSMAGAAGQLVGGRYRLVDPVGKGGMGQVWRGRDEILRRDVAVKEILLPDWAPEDRRDPLIARTMREARAAARLHHPGIVAVYDAVEHDGMPWIVMEFVAGPALNHVIESEGRLPWPGVAALGASLADALAHAHAAGVVHRDLKPANVLLVGDRPVLTDFGVARILDASTQLTSPGTLIGTPQFMPPEQIEGESVLAPVDIWALGATLYNAVEGYPPFHGPTLTAVLAAILTRPPPEPRQAGPLAPVLISLMSKAPGKRPDAAGLARQLAALLQDPAPPDRPVLTVTAPAATPPPPFTVTLVRPGTRMRSAVVSTGTAAGCTRWRSARTAPRSPRAAIRAPARMGRPSAVARGCGYSTWPAGPAPPPCPARRAPRSRWRSARTAPSWPAGTRTSRFTCGG